MAVITHRSRIRHTTNPLYIAIGAIVYCVLSISALSFPTLAQEGQALPGCEAPVPLLNELDAKLNSKALGNMKYSELYALQIEAIDQFIANYPREAEPPRRLIELTWVNSGLVPTLRDRFEGLRKNNPDDPLAQALAGYSLAPADPERGLEQLNLAKSEAPGFPLPYLFLAEQYSYGKSSDPKAMAENIKGYFKLCPASADHEAHRILAKTRGAELSATVAKALRARLQSNNHSRLTDYETLWALEFRTRPPQEHSAVRQQVTADLKRIERLNGTPGAAFQSLLAEAYKQSDVPEQSKAWEDRLVREYPKSSEALAVIRSRWDNAHKMPEDEKDVAAWAKWEQEYNNALKTWIAEFPDDYDVQHNAWIDAIQYSDGLSEKEVLQAFEARMETAEWGWSVTPTGYMRAADVLLRRKIQPRRALDALHQAEPLLARQRAENDFKKNRNPEEEKERTDGEAFLRVYMTSQFLDVARQLKDPAVAQSIRAEVESSPPQSELALSYYWLNRGRLAVIENRKADALAYYRLAFKTRTIPPRFRHGKLYDDLGDDAHALWADLGGTDAGFSVWSKSAETHELVEGYWVKPTKEIPEFELVDLSGKTWRLKDLRGKAVLISVWATWCGGCQAELPRIQNLYDRLGKNSDSQILTISVDEDLGLVEPYLKQRGYGFPVLPGYGFVSNLLDSSFGIPQLWIVDAKGQWQWTEVGFASNDWEKNVISKLEAAKAGN